MNNAATALMRIAVLAGGAAMGALLARWVDDIVSTQSQQKSDYDKARYSQGLSPISPQSPKDTSNIYTIRSFGSEEEV